MRYLIFKSFLILFLIWLTATIASAFSIGEWKDSVYGGIKTEAEKSFSAMFGHKVTIKAAGGILLGQIDLKDVTVPDLGRASNVALIFNPLKFAYTKGNMLAALTRIVISKGDFKVVRDVNNNWNVLSLLPKPQPQAAGPPPPVFAGRLSFKNCTATYLDKKGFAAAPSEFRGEISALNGEVDLRKPDQLKFSLSARIPEAVKVRGSVIFKTGKYELNVTATRLNVPRWQSYALPLPDLKVAGGLADLLVQISSPKRKDQTIALVGKAAFSEGALEYQNYKLRKISGNLFLADQNINLQNFNAELNGIPFSLKGRFSNFSEQNLGFKLSLREIEVKTLAGLFPQTAALDLKGKGSADLNIAGTVKQPAVEGSAAISAGAFYGQRFSGNANFAFKNNLLSAEIKLPDVYGGAGGADLQLDLTQNTPRLQLEAAFSRLDLFKLAQATPGIAGQADGSLKISGPVEDLKGQLTAGLSRSRVFGQPIDKASASFSIRNGEFYLDDFLAASATANFTSRGKIERDLTFNLMAEANGIKLSGKSIFGKTGVLIEKFRGSMRWKLDQKFLASPLRNLYASGEAAASEGEIGEQSFDRVQGKISIGGGKIEIRDAFFMKGASGLYVAGQTGLGVPTELKIKGDNLKLEDIKLLNYLLPEEARDPTGLASVEVNITGALSQETRITSLDPLLDLTVKGDLQLSNASIGKIPISKAQVNLAWEDRSLSISDSRIAMPGTSVALSLQALRDGTVKASCEGVVDLSLLEPATKKYGRIKGQLGISLRYEGTASNPGVAASFWIDRFRLNEVYLDFISGSGSYQNGQLILREPLLLRSGSDLYSLSGKAELKPEDPGQNTLDLEFKILQADLGGAFRLSEKLRGEFTRRFYAYEGPARRIDLANLALGSQDIFVQQDRFKLYSSNGDKKYFLKSWNVIAQEFKKSLTAQPEENMGGRLSGEIHLQGKMDDPSGRISAAIDKGYFRSFSFDQLTAEAALQNQAIKIENAVLAKGKGSITARGWFNFKNNLSLKLVAANMPLDVLGILFPAKELKGSFDMNADIDGSAEDPNFTITAAGKALSLTGINFDKAALSFSKKKDTLYLEELSLYQGSHLSSASGSILLSRPGKLALQANLSGDAVGLFNLFTEDVRWLKGDSSLSVEVQGTLDDPKINGDMVLNGGVVRIKALDSEIRDLQGTATIIDNLLTIRGLTGIWTGARTRDWANPLGVAGKIDLRKALAEKGQIDLDLAISPTHLYVAFPNLYTGSLRVDQLSLQGPFSLDFSQGPLLKGQLSVDNAVLTLSQMGAPSGKVFPLNFDLDAELTKNVYVVMGDVATLNLSNIFMNLEIAGEKIKITGNLAAPTIQGKISLKRGTVNIFNREFTLLSPETQKKFFPYDEDKIQENTAFFSGEEGPSGMLPEIYITSSVNVENQEKDPGGQLIKKSVIILARLKGKPGAKEKERGLNISLLSFSEDKTKSPPEIVPAAYSEQDLKVMLLPDFIKSLAGIGRPEETGKVDTNVVVADYLTSRVQTILFRGIERAAEQRLGLESLTLEYNLGPRVREAMGIKEQKGFEEEKPAWSVGFVKGLFDRLYIDVRYSQGGEQSTGSSAKTSINYQLTYKLSPIWSIIYYREPMSLTEITTGYQKVTLKAGFALW
jgi:hypothetical protein